MGSYWVSKLIPRKTQHYLNWEHETVPNVDLVGYSIISQNWEMSLKIGFYWENEGNL